MTARIEGLPSGPALATGRGTAALVAVVRALGLSGTGILVPVNICGIAVEGMLLAGARPVLHDVCPETGAATLAHLQAAWRPGVAGVLAVHGFGQPLDLQPVLGWARDHGVAVIEDVCLALGAERDGIAAGASGDAAFYSFGPGKTVDAGEGGAVSARDPEVAARLEQEIAAMPVLSGAGRAAADEMEHMLRGMRTRGIPMAEHRAAYCGYRPYIPTRLDATGAARIETCLAGLPQNVARRRRMAQHWCDRLAGVDLDLGPLGERSAPWRYNVGVDPARRDAAVDALRAAGHGASTWYPPIAPMYAQDAVLADAYPGAETFAARVVNLWVDDSVDETRIAAGAAVLRDVLGDRP